jgi:uracil-DNA glycosylase
MTVNPDSPYALSKPEEIYRRRAMLTLPHIAPLIEYAQQIATRMGSGYEIPYFDPCDGGINAEALFLLEAPGRKAMGSGFISRNNPDPSAKTMCTLLAAAAIPRNATLLWNVVPWYVGGDSSIRPVTKSDIGTALPLITELIVLLPHLKAVVLVGRKAQKVKFQLARMTNARLFESYHPSQRVMSRWPERRAEILDTFRSLASFLRTGA